MGCLAPADGTGLWRSSYGRVLALDKVTCLLQGPGVVGLLGPNGAGKTTLMRLLATVVRATSGTLTFDNRALETYQDLTSMRGRLGYLPQNLGYPPRFTVADFVAYCAWLRGLRWEEASVAANRVVGDTGISDIQTKRMSTLSGGQVRRVGIAQALVAAPALLLLDEPTSGLDIEHRLLVRGLLRKLADSRLIVISTHLAEDIEALCDTLLVLQNGHVVFEGSAQSLEALGSARTGEGSPFQRGYLSVTNAVGH